MLSLNQVGEILQVFPIIVNFLKINQKQVQLWKKAEYRKLQWINYNNLNKSKLKVRISTWKFHYNNCSIIKLPHNSIEHIEKTIRANHFI